MIVLTGKHRETSRNSTRIRRSRNSGMVTTMLLAAAISLASCNSGSVSQGLGSAAVAPQQSVVNAPQPAGTVGNSGQSNETALVANQGQQVQSGQFRQNPQGQNTQTASLSPTPPVSFLPVTGAPQSAVTSLANAMRNAAQSTQVPVVVSLQQGAKYQVKGYFSALNDGTGTILVYVWDVLDANGTRVHRISGQERGGGATGDPWSGVTDEVLNRVAQSTMASLRTWISTRNAG